MMEETPVKTKKWDTDKIVAGAAMLMSICALVISLYEASIMRNQQHASVWPHIDLITSYNFEDGFTILLANKGIGPAIIEGVRYTYKDSSYNFMPDVLDHFWSKDSLPHYFVYGDVNYSVLAPKESHMLLQITDSLDAEYVYNAQDSFRIEICYRSIYDKHWKLDQYDVEPINSCEL